MIIDYYVPSETRILAEQKEDKDIGPHILVNSVLIRYLIEEKNGKLYLSCFNVGQGSKEVEILEEICKKISEAKTDVEVNTLLMPLKESLLEEACPAPNNSVDIKHFLLKSRGYVKYNDEFVCLFNENSLMINTLSDFNNIQFVISREDNKSIFIQDEKNFYKDKKVVQVYLSYYNSTFYKIECILKNRIFKISRIESINDIRYSEDFRNGQDIKEIASRILKKRSGISRRISSLLE